MVRYKIIIEKSAALLSTNSKHVEEEMMETAPFTKAIISVSYLGINPMKEEMTSIMKTSKHPKAAHFSKRKLKKTLKYGKTSCARGLGESIL